MPKTNMWPMRDDRQERFLVQINALRPRLMAYCRFAVRDRNDLEDVLQTVMLTAYEKFDDFRPGSHFQAWVFQIASNVAFNANRKRARDQERNVHCDPAELDIVAELRKEYAYEELLRNPDQILSQVGDEVYVSLQALSPQELNVLLLKVIAGGTCREIGLVLKMPIGTVMCYLARARGKLRMSLSEYAKQYGFLSGKVKDEHSHELRRH